MFESQENDHCMDGFSKWTYWVPGFTGVRRSDLLGDPSPPRHLTLLGVTTVSVETRFLLHT